MLGINWLDFILVLLLALGLGIGYVQGLLRQVVSLAALYLGAVLATQYYHVLANVFKGMLVTTPGTLLDMGAFFIIMFGVMGILNFLALDAYRMKLRLLPALDYLGGMVLGLIWMWVIITLALNILTFATAGQSWQAADGARQTLHDGIAGSQIAAATNSTVPTLIAAIKPWLPAGLPSIFHL